MVFLKKYFYFVASIVLTGYLLVVLATLFNPFLAAFILALALKPFASLLEKYKIPRLLSTIISVSLLIIILFALVLFFQAQVRSIDFELTNFSQNITGIPAKIQNWITTILGVNQEQQQSILMEAFTTAVKNSTVLINRTMSFTASVLTAFLIFTIVLFFLLYYRKNLVLFLFKVTDSKNHATLRRILKRVQSVVVNYIVGLFLVIVIVGVLNILGLWFLGIEHAVLFGVMAAVLTLIPYIGIFIGSLLPAIFALLSKGSIWYALGVILIFMFVQFLEGNFLTPNIVGNQVSVNPFAAVLGLTVGGLLLGITGIMLALPILAIIKVICDEIKTLKPIGYLIGNFN
ncbi:transporter, permease [Legionella beliardensis]|uniref:Transporter, permease n=1 Tax=Legionella beliardensis TaxID=91822 RepID=A0A378I1N1_9GAMM|nr:AI-2E family transporter [Legionella beliardensis]STX28536.1 transporter, permease [Legionella beliardensis]